MIEILKNEKGLGWLYIIDTLMKRPQESRIRIMVVHESLRNGYAYLTMKYPMTDSTISGILKEE